VRRDRFGVASFVVIVLLTPASAVAWAGTPQRPYHGELAIAAAEALSDPARAFLFAHRDEFTRGSVDPDRLVNPFNHTLTASGEGGAGDFASAELSDAEASLSEGDVATAAYELGEAVHVVMDVAQPMHAAGPEAIANRHHTDYENATADHTAELRLDEVQLSKDMDPKGALRALAERSGARYARLAAALDAAKDDWSPEVKNETEEALRDALGVAAMLLGNVLGSKLISTPGSRPTVFRELPLVVAACLCVGLAARHRR